MSNFASPLGRLQRIRADLPRDTPARAEDHTDEVGVIDERHHDVAVGVGGRRR
ncbi:hypothetical protein ACIBXA_30780 [Micromonospora echinaurantiaca]|uniref:hypothetical protein n=1 Tax=Micromonospora echinaurantiaca TaxID=47857 RepID=UPI0037AD1823